MTPALVIFLVAASLLASTAAAGDQPATQPQPEQGPYCGIYCVYAAAKYFGRQIQFVSLARPEYVGSKEGSTATELKRAAEDHALHAEVLANLTTDALRQSPYPMVLHVRRGLSSEKYDHWLL